ncbi:MAG: aminotransferase class I/II-fold pyridoxal phosphate-dependent enzyme [Candidatus Sumerlaeaceae bacterium]|nr:aminotransferase class I/II-fold pyridoxal phosphate-dependent enzyme [Candidatus Sumerlaeaceae bacterium]
MTSQHPELALLGGTPTFPEPLHVGRPNIGDRKVIERLIGEILDRRWLSNDGPVARELEYRLAEYLSVNHVVLMCNATLALEIATRAAGMQGEVIVPSFTFVATAHALQWQGVTPVFCDIDPKTHNLSPEAVEAAITPGTTGIIGVHLWGRPCCVDSLTDIARRHKLALMFDAAHAFGCSHGPHRIGGFGHGEVFSFHATKFFNTFEGGALATNDSELASRAKLMRNFGFSGYDKVDYLGTNAKMTEVCAAMGLAGLDILEEFTAANHRNYDCYRTNLDPVPGISIINYDASNQNNWQYIILEVDPARSGLTRDELMGVLWAENVMARRYFYPGAHRMEPYRTLYPEAGKRLPNTEALCESVLALPNGTSLTEETVTTVSSIISRAVENAASVKRKLAESKLS